VTSSAPRPEPRRPSRTRRRWFRSRHEVLWLFLLAAAVRAAAAWLAPTINNDGISFLRTAASIRREGAAAFFATPDHPLGPWLASLVPPSVDLELAATALCVFAGAIAIWPLHWIARQAAGRHAATCACILYAALPKAIGVAATPLTTAVLLPLFLSGLALALAAGTPSSKRRRTARLVGAGLMCGLAYLCRPEGLVAAFGAVLAALLLVRRGRRLRSAALVTTAFLVVAAPYAAGLSRFAGRLSLSPKKDVAVFVGATDRPKSTTGEPPRAVPVDDAVRGTASAIEGAATVPVFLLLLVGVFSPLRWTRRRTAVPRLLLLGLAALSFGLVVRLWTGWDYGNAKHVLPGVCLLLPFAGEGFLFLGGFISRMVARRRLAVVLTSFLAIPLAVKALLRPEGETSEGARRLGEAIAAADPEERVVIASFKDALVAYYAGRALRGDGAAARDVPLWGSFRDLLERGDDERRRADLAMRLRTEGARWLVLDLFEHGRSETAAGFPQRDLAKRLMDDGVLGGAVVSPGGSLVAFPVRR
jgi:hypothetical protein